MRKNILSIMAVALLFVFAACTTSKKATSSYHNYPTECINQNADGTLVLRAWAIGEYSSDALKEAEKRAVEDVIFKGITIGNENRSMTPLVISGDARQRYEDYFARFFADDGAYNNFVVRDKNHLAAVKRFKNKGTKQRGVIVIVDRVGLKAHLKQDGIE